MAALAAMLLGSCKQKSAIPDYVVGSHVDDSSSKPSHASIQRKAVSIKTERGWIRGILTRYMYSTKNEAEKKYLAMLPESQIALERTGTAGKGSCSAKACWILSESRAEHILFYPEETKWENLSELGAEQMKIEIHRWAASRIGYSFP